MKKDLFLGKIKREYISYMWISIILVAFIGISVGSLLLYGALQHEQGSFDRYGLLILSILACLFGVSSSALAIFTIRKYPQFPKLRRLCFNSDRYFVGNDSKEYDVLLRSEIPFHLAARAAERNKGLEGIEYPKRYKVCKVLLVIAIIFVFAALVACVLLLENITLLPPNFQSEGLVFAAFAVMEVIAVSASFALAFCMKNMRKAAIDEYKKTMKK